MAGKYQAIVLAAGRGPDDPMARAYNVTHKCTLPVGGVSMLKRVVDTLRAARSIEQISISIEDSSVVDFVFPQMPAGVSVFSSERSAPLSAIGAIRQHATYPILITTADHALLTPEMVEFFCNEAAANGADFSAGLARAEVIKAAYPLSIRTYFKLGTDQVSGCNLFSVQNEKGLRVLERWKYLESVRKKPWRLVAAFGAIALVRFALGSLSLDAACKIMSTRLGLTIKPIIMPFAEAAIDIDKPADLDMAEEILSRRTDRK